MSAFIKIQSELLKTPKTWLVTGGAGFIGSNLVEALLKLNQTVISLDNFLTGFEYNYELIKESVSIEQWKNFRPINGDVCDQDSCRRACEGVDYVLHQAALGSVPRSINTPDATNANNVTGMLNMLIAARDAKVSSFTFASSSSVYGDNSDLPKKEDVVGNVLSPYALTKKINELYALQFAKHYGFNCIGLRYFNVFGKRQDPTSTYSAVIPKWVSALIKKEPISIFGDGSTSRDFCYIENVIQMNILAATTLKPNAKAETYNVALNDNTTLNDLYSLVSNGLIEIGAIKSAPKADHKDFRPGDIKHSQALIEKAKNLLGYQPTHSVREGLAATLAWYCKNVK